MSELKTFHKVICEASGYSHDEVDWRRDQLSLAEHIRWKIQRLEEVNASLLSQLEVAKEVISKCSEYEYSEYLNRIADKALKKIEELEGESDE